MYLFKHSETRNNEAGAYFLPYLTKSFADLLVVVTVKNVNFHPENGGSILR